MMRYTATTALHASSRSFGRTTAVLARFLTRSVANVPAFECDSDKGAVIGARLLVEEYAEVEVLVHAGSSLLSVVGNQRFFEILCRGEWNVSQ